MFNRAVKQKASAPCHPNLNHTKGEKMAQNWGTERTFNHPPHLHPPPLHRPPNPPLLPRKKLDKFHRPNQLIQYPHPFISGVEEGTLDSDGTLGDDGIEGPGEEEDEEAGEGREAEESGGRGVS